MIQMSAIGTKQTSASALHMSAFGGKADIFDGKVDITSAAKSNRAVSGYRLAPITVFIGSNALEENKEISNPAVGH